MSEESTVHLHRLAERYAERPAGDFDALPDGDFQRLLRAARDEAARDKAARDKAAGAESDRPLDTAVSVYLRATSTEAPAPWLEAILRGDLPEANFFESVEAEGARELFARRALAEAAGFFGTAPSEVAGQSIALDKGLVEDAAFPAFDTGQVFVQTYRDAVLFVDKASGRSYQIGRAPDGTASFAGFPNALPQAIEAPVVFDFPDGTRIYAVNRPFGEVVVAKNGEGRHIGFAGPQGEAFTGPADPRLIAELEEATRAAPPPR